MSTPNQLTTGAPWLSTSQASAALGVSERTITRRCKKGALVARFVAGVWEIDGNAIGQSVSQSDTANQTIGQGADTDLNASAANRSRTARQSDADSQPVGQAIRQGDRRKVEAELRAQLAREREFSEFLKAQLEEANRNTAEIRAALRAAQKQTLPQLTAGNSSTIEPAPANRQQRDENNVAANGNPTTAKGSQKRPERAESGAIDWNAVYGNIADELE